MALLKQQRPHERVTTQNLLQSATAFERDVGKKGITLQTLKDLSTLIDLYCLYDLIVVLGRGVPGHSANDSEFFNSLESKVVRVDDVTPDIAADVAQAGARHLATCLNRNPSDRLVRIVRDTAKTKLVACGLTDTPDTVADAEMGLRRLKKEPLGKAIERESRPFMFVRRTFLYLGYANATGRVFTPDAARAPVVAHIAMQQQVLRDKLLASLGEAWKALEATDLTGVTRVVPPLAAIVFTNAKGDQRRIATETQKLRNKLEPVRKKLRTAEFNLQGTSGQETSREWEKWAASFAQVEKTLKTSLRKSYAVTVEGMLNSLPDVIDAAGGWNNPLKWPALFQKGVTLSKNGAEMLRQVLTGRRLVELHNVSGQFPGPGLLRGSLQELFGTVRD